jgi:thiol-disulfide isomerase/thioredoxin
MPSMGSNHRTAPGRLGRRAVVAAGVALLLGGVVPWRVARAAHVVRPWPSDRPVPPLDLVALDGKRWRLEAIAGKVVVLNFWTTWCKPCRIEMPSLAAMAARRRSDGVVVAAVNYLEAPEKIRSYLGTRRSGRRSCSTATATPPSPGRPASSRAQSDRSRRPTGAYRRRRARLARRRGEQPARAAGRGAAQGLAIAPIRAAKPALPAGPEGSPIILRPAS